MKMIVLAVLGVALCGCGESKSSNYMKRSKTTEARQFVKKLYDGARAYYMSDSSRRDMLAPVEPQFPTPSAGPVPALGECCKQGGKCAPDAAIWSKEPWVSLSFSVDDPHYYSYEYKVEQKDGVKQFTVSAYGDLDCDGTYSTFSIFGEVNSVYADGPSGTPALYRENELE